MPEITYAAASGRLAGYLATPIGTGPWPGVVVIMDALGLSNDIRAQADRLAAAGYLAFAPDLYSKRGLRCVVATISASRSGKGAALADIDAARAWLASRDDCAARIGIIGFCMGGGFALLSAPRYDFAAAAVNYGEVPDELSGACPVLGSYGARDRVMRGRAERLERRLTSAGVVHDVKEYPDAQHSFMNRFDAPVLGPIMHVAGFNYHHPSAEDAWRRILDFFAEHLRESPAAGSASP